MDIAEKIRYYLMHLAPHVRIREAAKLLEAAHTEITQLRAQLEAEKAARVMAEKSEAFWKEKLHECETDFKWAVQQRDKLQAALDGIDRKAEAGLCCFDLGSVRNFHKEIRKIIAELSGPEVK